MVEFLEKFWMDYGPIIVLVSALVTLAGVIFNLVKNNSISTKSVDRTEQAERTLSAEHETIRAEAAKYSATQTILCERTSDTKNAVGGLNQSINQMYEEMLREKYERSAHYANLNDAQKQVTENAANMGRFAEEFVRLVSESEILRRENVDLKQENSELVQQSRNLRQKINDLQAELQQLRNPSQSYSHDYYEPEL